MRRSVTAFLSACLLVAAMGSAAAAQKEEAGSVPPGPPYPDPIEGVRVYDQAGVLGPSATGAVEVTIDEIEEHSGAQVVVYTQVKPESDTYEEAESDAATLMQQWAVGREGINDGLVILFDLDQSLCYGQIQLYAGAGYAAEHLSSAARQVLFEQDMVPPLADCDFDGALLMAMVRIRDAAGVSPPTASAASAVAPTLTTPVEDVFPTEMRGGELTATDVEIFRTEAELIEFLVGSSPDPEEIEVVRRIPELAGGSIADMTVLSGWHQLDDGTNVVNLGAFRVGGADTGDLRQSIHAMAMAVLDGPAYTEQEIAGKLVTVYDTAAEHGDYVNYLYVHDDIAWVFATFEENAVDVLEALPGS